MDDVEFYEKYKLPDLQVSGLIKKMIFSTMAAGMFFGINSERIDKWYLNPLNEKLNIAYELNDTTLLNETLKKGKEVMKKYGCLGAELTNNSRIDFRPAVCLKPSKKWYKI